MGRTASGAGPRWPFAFCTARVSRMAGRHVPQRHAAAALVAVGPVEEGGNVPGMEAPCRCAGPSALHPRINSVATSVRGFDQDRRVASTWRPHISSIATPQCPKAAAYPPEGRGGANWAAPPLAGARMAGPRHHLGGGVQTAENGEGETIRSSGGRTLSPIRCGERVEPHHPHHGKSRCGDRPLYGAVRARSRPFNSAPFHEAVRQRRHCKGNGSAGRRKEGTVKGPVAVWKFSLFCSPF